MFGVSTLSVPSYQQNPFMNLGMNMQLNVPTYSPLDPTGTGAGGNMLFSPLFNNAANQQGFDTLATATTTHTATAANTNTATGMDIVAQIKQNPQILDQIVAKINSLPNKEQVLSQLAQQIPGLPTDPQALAGLVEKVKANPEILAGIADKINISSVLQYLS